MATPSHSGGESQFYTGRQRKVALVGFGTVGKAVAELLTARNHEHSLKLTHIFNREVARKKVGWVPGDVSWTEDIADVLASDADIVVELIGGLEHAYKFVYSALQAGKSVVTANKQLMAHHGSELMELAREGNRVLAYGACVAGGVPVISGLHEGLAGDRLYKLCGILNGTCNYILTKLEREGMSFEAALEEAKQAGYAEADPADDIEGYDARAKLVILVRAGLNVQLDLQQIVSRSIRPLGQMDFAYAHQLGCTIRQISRAEVTNGVLYAAVEPALVPFDSPLARVGGSQNLVVSIGEFGGETVFSGHGAGGNPTAVAVVSDLLHVVRTQSQLATEPDRLHPRQHEVSADFETARYLRFVVRDSPGIIAVLAEVLAKHRLNIDSILQQAGHPKSALPFVITLEPCRTDRQDRALKEMSRFEFLTAPPLSMPILYEGKDALTLQQ